MIIEPKRAAPFLERAAAEQLRDQLTADGYEVVMEAMLGDARADIIARKGRETIVFEVKVPGTGNEGWARAVSTLQKEAKKASAQFRLVLVQPPRQLNIEVVGIENMIFQKWSDDLPAALDGIAASTIVDDISGIEFDSLILEEGNARMEGRGDVGVTLLAGDGDEVATTFFPFNFKATLAVGSGELRFEEAIFDLSEWYGPDH